MHSYGSRALKIFACVLSAMVVAGTAVRAGVGTDRPFAAAPEVLDPPRFEVAADSAYLLGVLGNPNSYEIGAEFLTARVRWGVRQDEGWLRGYNQFYVLAMAEPIFRGPENH